LRRWQQAEPAMALSRNNSFEQEITEETAA